MKAPIIDHQYTLTIRKVKKVPDARFKTGYREVSCLAQYLLLLYPNTHTGFNFQHIHNDRGKFTQTLVGGEASLNVSEHEVEL